MSEPPSPIFGDIKRCRIGLIRNLSLLKLQHFLIFVERVAGLLEDEIGHAVGEDIGC